jgi:tRNA dimethylallyltransferase
LKTILIRGIKLAKKIDGEIISADSVQFYKELNIGSGKDISNEVPHHLFDILSIKKIETLSSGEYARLAKIKIKEILERNKTPIIIGGSNFYLRSLLYK